MTDFLWWRDGVIYQVYLRSFADSDGDGLGDLPGLLSRLDYLAGLGVDALWLSPIYPSPDADFGYDVSDHTAVDPRFGSLSGFDALVDGAHRRGLRIILDMVLNHTSDRHPWFVESASSRDNPKADWYLWQERIPNNWRSVFGGRGWKFVPERGQHYFYMFTPEQPDVNWRNPDVYQAQLDVFRFWLERGVDGFRLDVFNAYFKDAQFRDNPRKFGLRAFDRQAHVRDSDQPEMAGFLHDLRALLDSYPERYAVGETFLPTPGKAAGYCGPDKLHAAFNFFFPPASPMTGWNPVSLAERIERNDREFAGSWPTLVFDNHDMFRIATRVCKGEDDALAKVFMALLLTLRGTPFMYYGEEIGMRDISLKRSEILDPPGRKYWPFYKGRDGCRSPMQWDASPQAGFTTGIPWLPVHPDYVTRNAAAQAKDPDSMLNFTRRLLALRKATPALRRGSFRFIQPVTRELMLYERVYEGQRVAVALNFSGKPQPASLGASRVLLSTAGRERVGQSLEPHEILILARP